VVGTQALAAKDVRFDDLVLVLIDEEQHFGAADNAKLSGLAKGVHTLWMSATPIPRTLAAGLAGFRDLSVIATPPVHRLPVVHPRQHRLQILNARTNQEALSVTPLLAQQCSGDGGVRRGSGSIAGVGAS
jgi:transcription-repair coupling factor (superfamily II helicase)